MLQLIYKKYNLNFKLPAGTSRGTFKIKPSWFLILKDNENPNRISIGECGLLPGLSMDDKPNYENKIIQVVNNINSSQDLNTNLDLKNWPSIRFGLEMLKKDYYAIEEKIMFNNDFTNQKYSIPINGLIWMGEKKFMFEQIKNKIEEGWYCIKMKIGAIDFDEEISLIKYIRNQFKSNELELRVDANGAFSTTDALTKLKILSEFDLHSIEQPIKAGLVEDMAELCSLSPLNIALDEDLIGINDYSEKYKLLKTIKPKYIILKPSLTGGWKASEEWINIAENLNISYWATSALESNIGLNAIAQWTATLDKHIVHGLGTGKLYTNNIESPLEVKNGFLKYSEKKWDFSNIY